MTVGLDFMESNFIRYTLNSYGDVRIVDVDNLSYGSNPDNLKGLENDDRYEFLGGDIVNGGLLGKYAKITRNEDRRFLKLNVGDYSEFVL